jgi:predicted SAM-dependent methyltransferase
MDMLQPYTTVGKDVQHLFGDARVLPFKDQTLDYVYSSHLIEDFAVEEVEAVLREWIRVIRVGGYLLLAFPNIEKYNAFCVSRGQGTNQAHRNMDLNINWMVTFVAAHFPEMQFVSDTFDEPYRCGVAFKRITPSE